jgi:hypothetical protein
MGQIQEQRAASLPKTAMRLALGGMARGVPVALVLAFLSKSGASTSVTTPVVLGSMIALGALGQISLRSRGGGSLVTGAFSAFCYVFGAFPTLFLLEILGLYRHVNSGDAFTDSILVGFTYGPVLGAFGGGIASLFFRSPGAAAAAPAQTVPETPEELTALARRYHSGDGGMKDLPKAFELMSLGAAGGSAEAQCDLGLMYYGGIGTGKDPALAAEWLAKAAAQGNDRAAKNLAMLLLKQPENGRGPAASTENRPGGQ